MRKNKIVNVVAGGLVSLFGCGSAPDFAEVWANVCYEKREQGMDEFCECVGAFVWGPTCYGGHWGYDEESGDCEFFCRDVCEDFPEYCGAGD